MSILEISNLTAAYGQNKVLHGIDARVEENRIVAIIGSNGAGKSTLLNSISGLVKWQGKILFDGQPLPARSHKIVEKRVIQVPEGRRVFAGISVEENLLVGAYCLSNKREIEELLEKQYAMFPVLRDRRAQDAGTLSGGEQQMMAICRALMGKPRLLLLDEPSLGLAPLIVDFVFEAIRRIRDSGVTVLLVEQNANRSLEIADYAYVMENGRITLEGTGREVLENPCVKEAYLGTTKNRCEV
ncbi:MAG: ABC transporter ATP-binding protein [Clostridiales bacterium]|jgi:branched-chain amino acid transport system ATP-binding protein|nr:ABC transporter ATP-binding protein [Clostridiales bacterium]